MGKNINKIGNINLFSKYINRKFEDLNINPKINAFLDYRL